MKKKELFIGIDVSKLTFDVTIIPNGSLQTVHHKQFKNQKIGFKQMVKWINLLYPDSKESCWVFCMEQTGVYSYHLCCFFEENNLDYCHESALKINRSLGIIKIEKSDKADSRDIAKYLYRHIEELSFYKLPSQSLQKLKALISFRRRLMKQKASLQVSSKEIAAFSDKETSGFIKTESNKLIKSYIQKIKKTELEIQKIMTEDSALSEAYKLTTSVVGIGPVIASYVIVRTNCFSNFENPKNFASYCGAAPFERSSGTSIKKVVRINKMADKELKTLLTNGAYAAIRYDGQIRNYFQRKLKEGKNEFSVINAIRNKLIHRVFATVNRGTPYVKMNF